MTNWINLSEEHQLDLIVRESFDKNLKGFLIFKHSTRCSISAMAKSRLERAWSFGTDLPVYYLDLLSYRPISNKIAELFNVRHQSPQILLIKDGVCIYTASHGDISVPALIEELGKHPVKN